MTDIHSVYRKKEERKLDPKDNGKVSSLPSSFFFLFSFLLPSIHTHSFHPYARSYVFCELDNLPPGWGMLEQ